MLKNRRSSSLVTDQLSKRSSISTSNVNIFNPIEYESIGNNVQSNNKFQSSIEYDGFGHVQPNESSKKYSVSQQKNSQLNPVLGAK